MMVQALDLGEDQEYSMGVGNSRSQETHPLPLSNGSLLHRYTIKEKEIQYKHLEAHAWYSPISS